MQYYFFVALGKLQFQNARSQFEREVSTSHLRTGDVVSHPSLSEAAQVIERGQTPNTVTASELVSLSTDREGRLRDGKGEGLI